MSAFRVGQKVVCVDASANPMITNRPPFTEGAVYSVAAVYTSLLGNLILDIADVAKGGGWYARRFRPVAYRPQSLEHDVEAFRKIAAHLPAPEKESAE